MFPPQLLAQIAGAHGTPTYIYSAAHIVSQIQQYQQALTQVPHEICYAVKANSNLAILRLVANAGAGFDIVSAGELYRVLEAGGDPAKTVFSGVGKTYPELVYALTHNIATFNCESGPELLVLNEAARSLGKTANFALRVNPDVDAATHPYISTGLKQHKFGIDLQEAPALYEKSRGLSHLKATGVSCHIGSQILQLDPLVEAAEKVLALASLLQEHGHPIDHVDLGGGLGIPYEPTDHAPAIAELLERLRPNLLSAGLKIMLEPGRSIVGNAGILLTKVLYLKQNSGKTFVIVDAAMNDLIRPALYQAHHEIVPLFPRTGPSIVADVVGPVCESGDFLAKSRTLPPLDPGDLLAIQTTGAYGFSQASNYNSRPRAAEVLMEAETFRVIRQRETFADLIRGEIV